MTEILLIHIAPVNCYLLRQGSRNILIDAAMPGKESTLIKNLKSFGLAPEALDLIILTHYHADHNGCAEYLREKYGVKIAMHPADSAKLRTIYPRGIMGHLLMVVSNASQASHQVIKPDILLENGLSLQSFGIDAEIVELPGHTAGSIGVLLDDGRLICGDALMNFTSPQLCHIAEDFSVANESVEKIKSLKVKTVYPGHGKPFELSPTIF